PEINLPKGWNAAPEESWYVDPLIFSRPGIDNSCCSWLYVLPVAIDANFRQKARMRPSNHEDKPLGPGWGTFVENGPYLDYVSQFADQDEVHLFNFRPVFYFISDVI